MKFLTYGKVISHPSRSGNNYFSDSNCRSDPGKESISKELSCRRWEPFSFHLKLISCYFHNSVPKICPIESRISHIPHQRASDVSSSHWFKYYKKYEIYDCNNKRFHSGLSSWSVKSTLPELSVYFKFLTCERTKLNMTRFWIYL